MSTNAYKFVYHFGVEDALTIVIKSINGFVHFIDTDIDCNQIYQAIDDIKTVNNIGGFWRTNEVIARGVYKFGTLEGTNHQHIPEVLKRIEQNVDNIRDIK